jgi:hypothetical protein
MYTASGFDFRCRFASMRLLQILLVLVALAACTMLGFLAIHVWSADAAAIEYLRQDLAYGWLLIQAAPLIGVACILALACAVAGLVAVARLRRRQYLAQ